MHRRQAELLAEKSLLARSVVSVKIVLNHFLCPELNDEGQKLIEPLRRVSCLQGKVTLEILMYARYLEFGSS
jgi:hypothetical protein